jgi:phage/plasmid-like protein (TIGR03299 family)
VAHNLNIENDQASLMYVGQVPWHGLGTRLEHPPETSEEAMKAANLDWEVGLKPVYCMEGGVYYEIPDKKAVVRLDKWGQPECVSFGLVGNDYRPLQNRDAFNFIEFLTRKGKMTFETAGALGLGERVWVLAKIAGEMKVKNCDVVEKYLLFSTGHNGRTAVQIRFTPVRVVCQNTLIASLSSGKDLFKIHHVPGMHEAIQTAEEAVQEIFDDYERLEKTYEQLARTPLTPERLTRYVSTIFPDPKRRKDQSEVKYEAALAKTRSVRNHAIKLFERGKGNNEKAVKGTLWAAYNGVVELIDHNWRYSSPWHRLEYTCFGEGERVKQLALKTAKEFMVQSA